MRHHAFLLISVFILLSSFQNTVQVSAQVNENPLINEIMTSNITSVMDEYNTNDYNCLGSWCDYLLGLEPFGIAQYDGDYPDWIELYNPGETTIHLEGYGLSDDPAEPFKWEFPNYMIPPKGHFLVFASGKDRKPAMLNDIWNTIIRQGDEWNYFIGVTNPPSGWEKKDFDDSSWLKGPSGFGYGDNDDATTLPVSATSVFLRKSFIVNDIHNISSCFFNIDYDDGFVAYLNGTKIAAKNIVWEGSPPSFDKLATTGVEAVLYTGGTLQKFMVDNFASLLVEGKNVLAVQVHNNSTTSPDLTAIPFLTLGLFSDTPDSRGIAPGLSVADSGGVFLPHTNFKLGSGAGSVILTKPDRSVADRIDYGAIPVDFSYGRKPDGSADWVVFFKPTPLKSNVTGEFPGFLDTVIISHPGGFYPSGPTVSLSVMSQDAEIRYTLDGSDPVETSTLYTGPLTISSSKVLKTRAFRNGILSSPVEVLTYMVGYSTTLPVVSLSTAPANLYDGVIGIYTKGSVAGHNNYMRDMERPCHVEFFEPDGTLGFSQDTGIRLNGRSTRDQPRKSFAVMARGKYGKDTFDYQFFSDIPITKFKSFILRNGGNDLQGSLIRDALSQDIVKNLNLDMMRSRPVVVFLNGEYWGIYCLCEKENEDYIEEHHGVDPSGIDMVELYRGDPPSPVVIEGSADNYRALVSYVETHDLSIGENYEYIKTLIDMDSYLDHHVTESYYANTDWLGNNYKAWRPIEPGGKWRYLMFDLDFAFDGRMNYAQDGDHDYDYNMISFLTNPAGPKTGYPPYSNLLPRGLFKNIEFRIDFINRTADYLNTIFLPEKVAERVDQFRTEFEPEMPNHIAKWKFFSYQGMNLSSMDKWYSQLGVIKDYAKKRPGFMRQHIIDHWGLPGTASLTVAVNDSAGGMIRINTVVPQSYPWHGTYFQGIPVKISAVPKPGYVFEGWSGLEGMQKAAGWESALTLSLPDTLLLTARFAISAEAMNTVVINEINYNSSSDFDSGDWVELYNGYTTPIDVSGWQIKDSDDSHSFIIPLHTTIEPEGYLVLCENSVTFSSLYPDVPAEGGFAFGFGSGGDSVRLFDNSGALVDAVTYDNRLPWPEEPDGSGATLALRNPRIDNAKPENWTGLPPHGSPGAPNVIPNPVSVVINEINYNSAVDFDPGDWVELYNALSVPVNLSGWVFRDGNDLNGYIIPQGTMLESGEYLVLCREKLKFTAVFPDAAHVAGDFVFGLSNSGDNLRLYNSEGNLVDQLNYGDTDPWPAEPDGNGPTLALKNPESDNSYYINWAASSRHGTPGERNDVYSLGVNDDNVEPKEFSVGQNFPNPFNPCTAITFNIPEDSHVTVKVYTILGQRVATLLDRKCSAGLNSIIFRPSGLASGIYFYTVKAGSHFEKRQMLYLK
jgi:hypothetical protein